MDDKKDLEELVSRALKDQEEQEDQE